MAIEESLNQPQSAPEREKKIHPASVSPKKVERSIQVSLLTGGGDRPYALGLGAELVARGIAVDFVGSDELRSRELEASPLLRFLNFWGDVRPRPGILFKLRRTLVYYIRLLCYAPFARPKVFHVLWNNKLEYFDRTILLLYYRLWGKRLVLTAHNVNIRKRDGHDSWLNRITLKIQYRLAAHIFVHTEKMKGELLTEFQVPDEKCIVIPFGINSTVCNSSLTPMEAKQKLGLEPSQKALLFFGNITPYKGLEFLVDAVAQLLPTMPDLRLIIAGRPKGTQEYWDAIREQIARENLGPAIIQRIEFVPDDDTEIYFKAGDVLVLSYTQIFQSGVLFLGYNFGLPVIASDIGALREEIVEGQTGFVCEPQNSAHLAQTIARYFRSEIYNSLASNRGRIRQFAEERYSWTKVGRITQIVYEKLQGT